MRASSCTSFSHLSVSLLFAVRVMGCDKRSHRQLDTVRPISISSIRYCGPYHALIDVVNNAPWGVHKSGGDHGINVLDVMFVKTLMDEKSFLLLKCYKEAPREKILLFFFKTRLVEIIGREYSSSYCNS